MTKASRRSGPLARFRVLDFSRMIAGPYCTQQLGDLGADVVKIESPQGDDSRRPSPGIPGGRSTLHMSANRNKKSVTLDLKTPAGKEIALALAARCDVLVENFATGVMKRLGLGYEAVKVVNPKIIYCSITGYGSSDTSDPPRPVYDGIIQAAAGMMAMTGDADGPPLRTPYSLVDTSAAMIATSSILAALLGRDENGAGQYVDVALFDVAMSIVAPMAIQTAWTGRDPQRKGNKAPQSAPSDVFRTTDGMIYITCANDRLFRRFAAEGLGAPELAAAEAYSSTAMRVKNIEAMTAAIEDVMMRQPTEFWMKRFVAVGVPASPVRSMSQVLASDDAVRAGTLVDLTSERGELFHLIRSPHRLGSMTDAPNEPPASIVGEHTDMVLRDLLGWSEADITQARTSGAFGVATRSAS